MYLNITKPIHYTIIITLLIICYPGQADEMHIDKAFLSIEKLNSSYQCSTFKEDEIINLKYSLRFSEGLEAAVHLWKNSEREAVELAWWRTPYRTTRILILCLYYGTYKDMDIDFIPIFKKEAVRFGPNEKKIRIEEIEYVEKNLKNIKLKLKGTSKNW